VTRLDAAAVSAVLFDEFAGLPAGVVAAESWSSWHRPGLLSFWVDDVGRADLEAVLGVPMDGHLLSWTAVTADGERGEAVLDTLWGSVALRILGHHFSVLRYRLAVLLSPEVHSGSRALLAWLPDHVQVVGHPTDIESAREVSERLQPPVPALLRPVKPRTRAQVREAEVRAAVQAERRRGSEVRRRRIAEVRAQLVARRTGQV
jgi:hypothetical protein